MPKISDLWIALAAGAPVPNWPADDDSQISQIELARWANMDEPKRIEAEQRHYGQVFPPVRSTDPNQPAGRRSKGKPTMAVEALVLV
jgi:hypothetical protein